MGRTQPLVRIDAGMLVAGVLALCALVSPLPAGAQSDGLVEERSYLRVKIGGRTVRLDSLIVKRADARGRLPIAFYSHGRPGNHFSAIDQGLDAYTRAVTRDFARRGWLAVAVVRRGFGLSDGAIQSDNHLPCGELKQSAFLKADADDIEAALGVVGKRPDADTSQVISVGHSAGGGLSIELGARNLTGLLAVIDLGGGFGKGRAGLGFARCVTDEDMRNDYAELGRRGRTLNLWFFANNDPGHPPDEIEAMRAAFAGAGGNVRLHMLGVLGEDGHAGLLQFNGRTKWLAELDTFFGSQGLPTWPRGNVDVVLQRLGLSEASRKFVEAYLASPGEAVLVRSSPSGRVSYAQGLTVGAARSAALRQCQAAATACAIVMENDRWIPGDR